MVGVDTKLSGPSLGATQVTNIARGNPLPVRKICNRSVLFDLNFLI